MLSTNFSNSARVTTVLQSAGAVLAAGFAGAAPALAAAGRGCGLHTPVIVSTAAVAGTDSAVSGRLAAACGPPMLAGGRPGWAGGGAPCWACPANPPNNTHISQLLRIKEFLQDWCF